MRWPWTERVLRFARRELSRFARALTGGSWQRALFRAAVAAVVLVVGAVLYARTGFVSVAASSGHSPPVYWFLDFTKRSAVRTQSLGIEVPSLDDAALRMKGAGHYASACAPCHGAPGSEPSTVAQGMTPKPPYLPAKLERWNAREKFWIVKNGIKFTGMPAWPASERDDEVWAVVSFLEALPEMDAAEYTRLAYGETAEPGTTLDDMGDLSAPFADALANCARCHGEDGLGRGSGAYPRLANQQEEYLLASLRAYASGERRSGIMQPVAAGLDAATMQALARRYAALPGMRVADADAVTERGRRIAELGIPERGVPACAHCHGPGSAPRNPLYPELAGQHADYLILQLGLFKEKRRGGTPYAQIMETVAAHMTRADMREVAEYYAALAQATP